MRSWRRSAVTIFSGIVLLAVSAGNAAAEPEEDCALPVFGPGPAYHPAIDPEDFSSQVDNPMFPLVPGTTMEYRGMKDGAHARDLVRPSSRTVVIAGVRTRVVKDRLYMDGTLEERTSDYFAQDRCGNVWYFGEDTAELAPQGNVVSTDGSWHAGVDGAKPGVVMQADPQLGRRFRQEWLAGQAEDTYKAIDLSAPVTTPYGHYASALRTEETTALEPNVIDNKVYARGVGEVVEVTVRGAQEKLVLVDVRR